MALTVKPVHLSLKTLQAFDAYIRDADFIPDSNIQQLLAVIQDYDKHTFKPEVIGEAAVQRAVFSRRRCSLALVISLKSAAGRISKMLPNFSAGCCAMSCTA